MNALSAPLSDTADRPVSRREAPAEHWAASSDRARLTQVTANLTPRAVAALAEAARITGDTRTDTLNRSLQVYAYLSARLAEGQLLFVEDPATGQRERVVLY